MSPLTPKYLLAAFALVLVASLPSTAAAGEPGVLFSERPTGPRVVVSISEARVKAVGGHGEPGLTAADVTGELVMTSLGYEPCYTRSRRKASKAPASVILSFEVDELGFVNRLEALKVKIRGRKERFKACVLRRFRGPRGAAMPVSTAGRPTRGRVTLHFGYEDPRAQSLNVLGSAGALGVVGGFGSSGLSSGMAGAGFGMVASDGNGETVFPVELKSICTILGARDGKARARLLPRACARVQRCRSACPDAIESLAASGRAGPLRGCPSFTGAGGARKKGAPATAAFLEKRFRAAVDHAVKLVGGKLGASIREACEAKPGHKSGGAGRDR
jgi:hypothetical protein